MICDLPRSSTSLGLNLIQDSLPSSILLNLLNIFVALKLSMNVTLMILPLTETLKLAMLSLSFWILQFLKYLKSWIISFESWNFSKYIDLSSQYLRTPLNEIDSDVRRTNDEGFINREYIIFRTIASSILSKSISSLQTFLTITEFNSQSFELGYTSFLVLLIFNNITHTHPCYVRQNYDQNYVVFFTQRWHWTW